MKRCPQIIISSLPVKDDLEVLNSDDNAVLNRQPRQIQCPITGMTIGGPNGTNPLEAAAQMIKGGPKPNN